MRSAASKYVLLALAFFTRSALATVYPLDSSWSVVNNGSLDTTSKSGDTLRILFMENEHNSFALVFYDINSTHPSSSPDDFFLLGVVTMPYSEATLWNVVWCANPDTPVKHDAKVGVKQDGNLALWDADGLEVWSTNVTAGLKFGGLELEASGNFKLLGAQGAAEWESFGHPTDTLLPNQRLSIGGTLTSRNSKLVVEPAGLALYALSNAQQRTPYWISSLSMEDDLEGVLAVCNHPATLVLDYKQGLVLSFDVSVTAPPAAVNTAVCGGSGSKLYNGFKVELTPADGNGFNPHQFVRLNGDGNLELYVYAVNERAWRVAASVITSTCDLPDACGSYGICSDAHCSCPSFSDGTAFEPVDAGVPALGCTPAGTLLERPNADLPCSGAPAIAQRDGFVGLSSVDYFANRYVSPDSVNSSADECRQRCAATCSCGASFFHNDTGACYLAGSVRSLQRVPRPGLSAQLKLSAALEVGSKRGFQSEPGSPGSPPYVRDNATGNVLAIGLSAGLGGAGVLLLFLLWTFRRRLGLRNQGGRRSGRFPSDGVEEFLDSLPGLPPRYSFKDLQVATGGFRTKLGIGGFGTVYEGVFADGMKVAVKRLEGARQGQKEFRAEVATIGSIHHINLVRLRGFCAEHGHRLLVYEYMPNGSLDKWLFAPKESVQELKSDAFVLSWNTRFKISMGTARGLAYLHEECSSRIVHMDIKPQNILLDADFFPKVSDFGLSKLLDHENSGVFTNMRGTPGYLAPELLLRSQVSEKIDIYSYGIVLIEILTGRKSLDLFMEFDSEYFPSWAMNMARDGRLRDAVDQRMGDLVPELQLQRVIQIIYWCVHRDFRRRPSMKEVVQMLEGLTPVPPIPQAELADLSSFKLPRRQSFTVDPEKLGRALSDQGITVTTLVESDELSGPR